MPLAVGLVVSVLIVWFVLSGTVTWRQRSLWIAVFVVGAFTVLVWDAIELRVEDLTGAFYWRSDWDWDSSPGGVTEASAATVLFVGPLVSAALAYSAVARAASHRLSRAPQRILVYAVAAPLGLLFAFGLVLVCFTHPYIFFSPRTS